MALTIKDVARRAGVSPTTASRVLSGRGYTSEEARARVVAAADELGYRPNTIARALVQGATRSVGLVVGDIENPFFAALARSIGDALDAAGFTLLLTNSDERPDRERRMVEALRDRRVDGLIVAPAAGSAPHLVRAVRSGLPLVQLDRAVEGLPADAVLAENAEGAESAVRHLTGLGHRGIACLADPIVLASTRERVDGFRTAMRERGLEPRVLEAGGVGIEDGRRAAQELLSSTNRPTAVFTTNNQMTAGVMRALSQTGLRAPTDVALIGFDDLDWTTLVDPPLTVVAQPVPELGRTAAERLLARLDGDDQPPRRIRLRTELIVRASCGEPR